MRNTNLEKNFETFSRLSDRECALIIQNNFSEALESNVYIEAELISKLLSVGFEIRQELCQYFANALRRNYQMIGNRPIGQWLAAYLAAYENKERSLDTFYKFVKEKEEAQRLTQADQVKLMRILRLFDYLLIVPFFDLEDAPASTILKYAIYKNTPAEEVERQLSNFSRSPIQLVSTKISEKLAIRQAIQKYPKLGEQNISSYPLKIKSFDRPVRPSIRNWLYDYTSHLGQTGHSSMDRTNYLFRSENAARLSSPERERLAEVLKSFDENTPLSIDAEAQEVVLEHVTHSTQHATRESVSPLKPPGGPFVKSYPATAQKPSIQSRAQNIQYKMPDRNAAPARHADASHAGRQSVAGGPDSEKRFEESGGIAYVNPYPRPGSHEVRVDNAEKDIANVRFSEGTPKSVQAQPRPYIPSHPKNVIYPHYPQTGEERSEPRIEGNIVDLREDQQS